MLERNKGVVLVCTLNVDHPKSFNISGDIARFHRELEGIASGCMTFVVWGLMIFIDESQPDDPEIKMQRETEWGSDLLSQAERQVANQIQIIIDYRTPVSTKLEAVE